MRNVIRGKRAALARWGAFQRRARHGDAKCSPGSTCFRSGGCCHCCLHPDWVIVTGQIDIRTMQRVLKAAAEAFVDLLIRDRHPCAHRGSPSICTTYPAMNRVHGWYGRRRFSWRSASKSEFWSSCRFDKLSRSVISTTPIFHERCALRFIVRAASPPSLTKDFP